MYQIDGQFEHGVIIFAHGAGVMMDAPWMTTMAKGLARCGFGVVRFEFPYMQKRRKDGRRRPPDRMPQLVQCMLDVIQEASARWPDKPIILAGKSMGGRVALHCSRFTPCRAVVVFGYPFHPRGDAGRVRLELLREICAPVLIVQGERDPFGRREEVTTYAMDPSVDIRWLPAADHDFRPLKSSGIGMDLLQTQACEYALEFVANVGA